MSFLTNGGKLRILNGSVDLLTDTIKVMLLNNAYAPDRDHQYVAAIVGNEVSGAGYASGFAGSGRKTLASKAVAKNDTTDVAYFDAADVPWSGLLAGTIAYVAVVKEITSDADSPVIAVIQLPAERVTDGSLWTWIVSASGIFQW